MEGVGIKEVVVGEGAVLREVREGDVVVRVGVNKGKGVPCEGEGEVLVRNGEGAVEEGRETGLARPRELNGAHVKNLVRMYRSQKDDLKWARNGLLGTVIKEEATPLIQSTVEDAGRGYSFYSQFIGGGCYENSG